MTDKKRKISIVTDPQLADRLRQHQERLSRELGVRVSLNQVTVSLLTRGLEVSR